ncbi:hypothetical protein SBA1_400054 [Candidatus Sulfotelmatobacter kueseliae]|uniref:Uncharacterized protein n=1 Tax=Candidatus Sulfotelmatobacter kueseliae TaxID=2042962 RepID=A0A2U3KQS9_9BACT|nr:hypothetical protein SBA1_400054 [Candidatus Sulfotelmatobacter kueseliae]
MCPVHCDHTDHTRSRRYVRQDWEKLYRAAILESDRSKLLQRIGDAEAAILERSRSSSKPPDNNGKERDAITRALHILSLLREAWQQQQPHAMDAGKRSAPSIKRSGLHLPEVARSTQTRGS